MSVALLVQALLVVLIVGWSMVFAARRLLPVTSRRVWARLLDALDRPALPAWAHRLVNRLRPRGTQGGSCADGCSACGGCAAAARAPAEEHPLTFRPREKN
ncbi:MAG: hypothetical protein LBQ20_05300 [Rhodanobacter sp.]|jgi:hypothetical protein|nr:hypothetical protein [Rhodanobacter sp.]